jgi:hypothetical protein
MFTPSTLNEVEQDGQEIYIGIHCHYTIDTYRKKLFRAQAALDERASAVSFCTRTMTNQSKTKICING